MNDVRQAFTAFTMLSDSTKLGADAAYSIARMVRKLKGHVKDFERAQVKLYKDAGGIVAGNGIEVPQFVPRETNDKGVFTESREDFEKRFEAHRVKVNGLSEELEKLNEREVEVELEPIKLSLFPKKRKNDKGEEVEVEYNANHFANAGPFIDA